MKESIAASYAEEQRARHGHKIIRSVRRQAVVIGSDGEENIGADIAHRLAEDEAFVRVEEPSLSEFDVRHLADSVAYFANGQPDTLVLSHGVMRLDWFEDIPRDETFRLIDTNLTGTIYALQSFVRATIDAPYRKRIVVVGSMAYKRVLNGSAVYCATKAAVAHLVACLGWELTPKGFDIVAIHPSNVANAPMSEETVRGLMRYRDLSRSEAESYWASVNLLPRFLSGDDIAEFAHWFATSDAASYLSGTQVDLSAGQR